MRIPEGILQGLMFEILGQVDSYLSDILKDTQTQLLLNEYQSPGMGTEHLTQENIRLIIYLKTLQFILRRAKNKQMEKSYELIFSGIIPATQEAFKKRGVVQSVRVTESNGLKTFKETIAKVIAQEDLPSCFPTRQQVFVAIIQFYTSKKKDYNTRDVDNMAKTMLDILEKNKFYERDSQVRTLLVSKRVDLKIVPQNLGYIYIKVLEDSEDIEIVDGMLKRALSLYSSIKENKVAI